MKKLFFSLVLILSMGIMMSANESISEKNIVNTEEYGCARDCVDYALETVQPMRDHGGSGLERELAAYMMIYESCYGNC